MENTPGPGLCLICLVHSPSLLPRTPIPGPLGLCDFHQTGKSIKFQPDSEKGGLHVAPGEKLVRPLQRTLTVWIAQGLGGSRLHLEGLGAGTPVSSGWSGLGWLLSPQSFSLFLAELGNDNTPNRPYPPGCWGQMQ